MLIILDMTKIRLVSNDDDFSLRKFYIEAYGSNHILNNPLHHNWQFKNNPYNFLNTKSIIIAENENEIIAHMGVIPTPFKIFNDTKIGAWHVSYFTLEKYRGMGLGSKMVQLSDSIFDCIGGMGNSDASNSIHVKNGGKNYGNINRYIKILQKEHVEKFINKQFNFNSKHNNIIIDTNFKRITKLDSTYDYFWEVVKERFPITVNRTREYLSWRYIEHPLIDYHFMILFNNQDILGYSVLRFEDNNKELIAGRIIDFVSTKEHEKTLLQNVINYFNTKVDFIDFYSSGLFYDETSESLGFFNNLKANYEIPTVFDPINRSRNSIDLHFKIKNFSVNDTKYYDYDNLFFVKSDADQDRAF